VRTGSAQGGSDLKVQGSKSARRRLVAGAGLAALAVAVCAPGVAAAQAALGGPDKPFTVGVQEITAYDSNPARGSAVNAAERGIEPDEVTLSPSITAVYSRSVGLQGLALSANFGYDYHTKNSDLSSEHLNFSVIGNRAVGAFCSLGGNANYNRSQSDLSTLTVDVTRNVIQTYSISGSESCHTGAGLTESVQVTHSATQNTNGSLVNYDVNGISGLIGYTNPTIGTVGVTVAYDQTNYGNDPLQLGTTPEQMGVTSVGLSLTRPIGARLTGSASVSWSHSSDQPRFGAPVLGQTSFSGFTTSIGLSYLVGPRLRLSTDISRNVSATLLQGVGYSVVNSADLTANYTVSSRINAAIGGSWSHTDYNNRDLLVLQTTPGWQETNTFFARTSMTLGRRWGASLEYRLTEGRSDLSLYNYVSNYVGLTLSASL
jgi:hypothetical protein